MTLRKKFVLENDISSGLGYIAGAYITQAFGGEWRWALRVRTGVCIDDDIRFFN